MPHRIAIVTCSTRQPRLNPYISAHVHALLAASPVKIDTEVELLDLAAQGLPLYDEPAVPASLPAADPTPHYTQSHTRAWSATVRCYDAYVFVTPQYNWSVPASLKNALDYLYHEWSGKPAAIVTYGHRGGAKAAVHLSDILNGLRMAPVSRAVALPIHGADITRCATLGSLEPATVERWCKDGAEEQLHLLFKELLGALEREGGQ